MPTKLSTLISRLDRYQSIQSSEEKFKVMDLDSSIREKMAIYNFPWFLKDDKLKIFPDVFIYSFKSDQKDIINLDDPKKEKLGKPDFQYTSIKQFLDDPNNRNLLTEVWDEGVKYIGLKYKNNGLVDTLFDESNDETLYTYLGDIVSISENDVMFSKLDCSIRFNVTNSSNVSTLIFNRTPINDENFYKKWFFVNVYLESVPTKIKLEFGTSDTRCFSKEVTTQFDGRAFKENDWNMIAIDLNDEDSLVGTIDYTDLKYAKLEFTGLATGSYYINGMFLKSWLELDLLYYTKYPIIDKNGVYKSSFFNYDTGTYDLDDQLLGDDEFADIVEFDAELVHMNEKENTAQIELIKEKRAERWAVLFEKYPELNPLIMTDGYNFIK